MQPRAEVAPTTVGHTSLLTIHGASGAWALPSAAVATVETAAAAEAEQALDVDELLGFGSGGADLAVRLLTLQAGGAQRQLLVRGTLALLETPTSCLLPLPGALCAAAPLLSHVVVVDGRPSLLVLSPERLLEASRLPAHPAPPACSVP